MNLSKKLMKFIMGRDTSFEEEYKNDGNIVHIWYPSKDSLVNDKKFSYRNSDGLVPVLLGRIDELEKAIGDLQLQSRLAEFRASEKRVGTTTKR